MNEILFHELAQVEERLKLLQQERLDIILKMREEGATFSQIAKMCGLSAPRVYQIIVSNRKRAQNGSQKEN